MASESETILGAGGIAALVTLVLGAVTKYLLDRKKVDNEHEAETVKRMQARIDELEEAQSECLRRDAEQSKRIGYLEAKVETLQSQLDFLKGQKP